MQEGQREVENKVGAEREDANTVCDKLSNGTTWEKRTKWWTMRKRNEERKDMEVRKAKSEDE